MTKSQRMLYVTRFGLAKLRILFEVEYSSSKEETCIAFCEAFDRTSDVRFKECTAVEKRIISPELYKTERRLAKTRRINMGNFTIAAVMLNMDGDNLTFNDTRMKDLGIAYMES